jgi:putative salt-induced outer membrane protein YdiY
MSRRIPLVSLLVIALAAPLIAADAPVKPWTASSEFSFVTANGNTKATTLSSKNKVAAQGKRAGLELEAGGLGSQSRQVVTAEQYFAGEKTTWKWSDRNFFFEKFRWDKDRFAGLDSRYDGSAGVGRELLVLPKDILVAELGGGYVYEDRANSEKNDFGAGRAYAKYTHAFSDTANFLQDAEYLHNFKDSDDYRVNAETAVTAAVTKHFSLKTSFDWKHVNKPPTGFLKNDTLLSAAVLFTY